MKNRRSAGSLIGGLALLGLACDAGGRESAVVSSAGRIEERSRAIHDRVLTLDTHVDIPSDFATEAADPGVEGDSQVDLPKMRRGGLDGAFFIVYVGQTVRNDANYAQAKADAMIKFDAIHRMTEELYPEQIGLAMSADDVVRIHAEGRKVAMIGIENGYVIGKDLRLLEKYHGMGARYITLAHVGHNDIADSSMPRSNLGDGKEEHGGVSEFGEQVIAEMNRLGIMVDVSHLSKQAMLDAARLSRAPVIASHSSTRALCDVPRNLDDEQLLALKKNGGVMQTVALDGFVVKPTEEKAAALAELREGLRGRSPDELDEVTREDFRRRRQEIKENWPGATVSDFVDHIDHAVELIGIDHVGISSDFDGGGGVEGWSDASETFNVTLELVRRGYDEEEITKLWGGNLLRVWREVEKVSSQIR